MRNGLFLRSQRGEHRDEKAESLSLHIIFIQKFFSIKMAQFLDRGNMLWYNLDVNMSEMHNEREATFRKFV